MILSNFPTKTITPESIGAIPNPTGGTAGQVLTKTADGSAWEDAPSGLPDGGADGQMLYKSADGAAWGDKPVMIVNATDAEDASLTTDKTLDEIKEAYLNDVNIFIKYTDVLLPLVLAENVEGENPSFKFFNYSTNTISGDLYALIEAEIEIFRRLGEDFAYFHLREGGLVPTDGNQGEMLYCDNTGVSHWGPAPKGIPSGGTPGQVLTKASTGEEWSDAPSGLPEGGTEGQILEKTSSGAAWVDAPESGLTQEQADERYLQLTGGEASNQPFNLTNTIGTRSTTFNLVGEIGANLYFNGLGGPVTGITFNNAGIEFTGGQGRISYLSSPENDEDAANKAYVDQAVANIGGGIVVQATAPENTSLGWIDTSVGGVMKYYDPETSTWKGIIGVWG